MLFELWVNAGVVMTHDELVVPLIPSAAPTVSVCVVPTAEPSRAARVISPVLNFPASFPALIEQVTGSSFRSKADTVPT